MQIQELAQKSREAVEYSDSTEAYRLIPKWENFLREGDFQNMTPASQENVKSLVTRLRITAFPQLDDEESASLLENNLLDFFKLEIPLEAFLMEKLFLVPYGVRREVRDKLEKAVQNNKQILGAFSIGAWIREFDKNFNKTTRDSSAIVKFLNENTVARSLPSQEKQVLKKILHAYDYYLIYTLPDTGEGLDKLKKSLQVSPSLVFQSSSSPIFPSENSRLASKPVKKKPLREALNIFPGLGEQIVTSSPLKLKQFDQPVRPSIKNWLHDYTSHLGQERHSSMDRMRYLFGAENAKILSSQDRDKLAIILKSFDEDALLSIDSGRQEVVFETIREQRSENNDQQKKVEPKNDLFIRPYSPASRMTNPAPIKTRSSIQGSTFPLSDKSSNSSRLNLSEIPKSQTLAKPEPEKITFANPFPKPETRDIPDSNISNVRFTEHLPSQSFPKPETPVQPKAAPTDTPYKFTRPPQNMIYPHLRSAKRPFPRSKPEPKFDGNTVDLSGGSE